MLVVSLTEIPLIITFLCRALSSITEISLGTTYTPHIHMVFGFTDQNGRYWSTPIEWQGMEQRALLPFPAAYEYGSYKYFDYGFPKLNHCVKIV